MRLDYTYKPVYWRLRAEETRTIAANMTIVECRDMLLRMATDYDTLADTLEHALQTLLNNDGESPGRVETRKVTPFRPAG